MNAGFIVLIIVVFIGFFALALYLAHLRREMWREIAKKYGFRYDSGDPFSLVDKEFALFAKGHSRKVTNTIDGDYEGLHVILFDFKYTTGSGKNQSTHNLSAGIIEMPIPCHYLHIRPEHFLHRIADFFGFDDFDFEFDAFNRAFHVTGDSKKFAYDICHPGMMEFLMEHQDMCWEMRGRELLFYHSNEKRIDKGNVEYYLQNMKSFVDRVPEYLVKA